MDRRTALQVTEYKGFGGSYYDSIAHADLFRSYKPHYFGVKTAQLFSSELKSDLINKKFTYMTVGKSNIHYLPGGTDDYEWCLVGDTDIDFRITEVITTQAFPGKAGQSFRIALDRDWLHEPAVIKSEEPDVPMLKIIGHPIERSANSWEYEVELQTGDMNAWLPLDLLQPGKRFIRTSSQVSDELNTKYAPDQYGNMFKLRSWTGQFANKIEFSDKFIRTEIANMKSGKKNMSKDDYSIGSGYIYQADFKNKAGKKIKKGVFITKAEARLLERTERDRELMFEFGQLQKTEDRDTGRPIKTAPGWRQLVRDGHYMEHNGSLTLGDIFEYLNEIFITRKNFADRKIKLCSGEGGIEFLSRLIAQEASTFNTVDTHFIRGRKDGNGYHSNELEFGAQFTKIKMTNGIEVEIVYDPMKDDRKLFPIKAPGTNRTVESYAIDIFDFGVTDQKAAGAGDQNITCVIQDGVEEYYTVSNVYDFYKGAETGGNNVYSNNKEAGIYRTLGGALTIWDISRCGRIEFNPNI